LQLCDGALSLQSYQQSFFSKKEKKERITCDNAGNGRGGENPRKHLSNNNTNGKSLDRSCGRGKGGKGVLACVFTVKKGRNQICESLLLS